MVCTQEVSKNENKLTNVKCNFLKSLFNGTKTKAINEMFYKLLHVKFDSDMARVYKEGKKKEICI